ncbi:acetoin utilization protein AcuC [Vulcanisaeta sp. JCM 16159]|uniref:acetoin utilization protein AcuC n=1 Tax=Vulcanisaeta sp. JCM 16159 TaxID=1295371 RepID=UPI0006CF41E4|nr:acetoin utilization protein AcuC [Vulcanisaeta sp. JCM 16159]
MEKLALAYSDKYLDYNFGPWHPFKPHRERQLVELLREHGLLSSYVDLVEPRPASDEELMLVHTKDYIDYVKRASINGVGYLDYGDTPAFRGIHEAATIRVGGTLLVTELVNGGKYVHGFNPGGGFHHAKPSEAAGFCVYNDIAIAVKWLRKHGIGRVAVVDIDVHHADGTQVIFNSEDVLLVSTHGYDGQFYPGTGWIDEDGIGAGKGLKVNIPLPPHTGDDVYSMVIDEIIRPILDRYSPEFLILQFGVDAHTSDELGILDLTTESYLKVLGTIHEMAHKHAGGRLVLTGGGGYNIWNTVKTWFLATVFLTDPNRLSQFSNYFDQEPTRTPGRYYEEALYIIDAVKQRFGL